MGQNRTRRAGDFVKTKWHHGGWKEQAYLQGKEGWKEEDCGPLHEEGLVLPQGPNDVLHQNFRADSCHAYSGYQACLRRTQGKSVRGFLGGLEPGRGPGLQEDQAEV